MLWGMCRKGRRRCGWRRNLNRERSNFILQKKQDRKEQPRPEREREGGDGLIRHYSFPPINFFCFWFFTPDSVHLTASLSWRMSVTSPEPILFLISYLTLQLLHLHTICTWIFIICNMILLCQYQMMNVELGTWYFFILHSYYYLM